MIKSLKPVVVLIGVMLLTACEESPFLSRKEADRLAEQINTSRDPFHAVKNVVAIINNDVYYFDRLDTIPRKLTNTPESIKTQVKLSSDKTKVAYINEEGHPVIIDSVDGAPIGTLTQYNYITQMGWVRDSNTLFMLIGREVELYGESIEFLQPESFHPWDEVKSFSMNGIGDQGYIIHRYNGVGEPFEYHSSGKEIDEVFQNFEGDLYDYVDFYDDEGNFLLGYNDPWGDGIERVICVQNYKFWSAYEWDQESMQTPEFNADHEVLLYGTVEGLQHFVKGVYLGTDAYPGSGLYDRLTKTLESYPSSTPVYVDWSQ
jgi:hypothetical protein